MKESDQKKSTKPLARQFRIFLASPGDVNIERGITAEVVNELRANARYRDLLNVQLIGWDQPGVAVPMTASQTPQETIVKELDNPSTCDLVICIFWGRIGTLLSKDHVKPDGERYRSGTEWEYWDAVNAYHENGSPDVLIYQRKTPLRIAQDKQVFEEFSSQWRSLNEFLTSLQNEDGSYAVGINDYVDLEDYRPLIRAALEFYLDKAAKEYEKVIECDDGLHSIAQDLVTWEGNPYPGASAFDSDFGKVFFGRDREIDTLRGRVSDPDLNFLIVTGPSGCGKSSLLTGGLIPRLRNGELSSSKWIDVVFRPAELANDPFRSLASALSSRGTIKALKSTDPDHAIERLDNLENLDPAYLADIFSRQSGARSLPCESIIVVDQLEELFTLVESELSERFLIWIKALCNHPHIRVVATLRDDFFSLAAAHPVVAGMLRQENCLFPLALLQETSLREIIERPARAAGVSLEEGLVDIISSDVGREGGALALTAFALHELYERGHYDGLLSRSDYAEMGGIKGAISKKVDAELSRKKPFSTESFDQLFSLLVRFNAENLPTRQRELKKNANDELLVDALISARVLLSEKNEEEIATIEIAHESLFDGWPKLREWIQDSEQRLRSRRDLEQTSREWQANGRPLSGLRGGQLLKRYKTARQISDVARDYLRACVWRTWTLRILSLQLGILSVFGATMFVHIKSSNYPLGVAVQGLAVNWGIKSARLPELIEIPAGSFAMGDLGDSCRLAERPPGESECRLECSLSEQAGSCLGNEKPVRFVSVKNPFLLGKQEVSFAEYDLFAAATGRRRPYDELFTAFDKSRGEYPVINISWEDATSYTQWLSRKTGERYRLPTELEWEYAARAGTGSVRFWETDGRTFDVACRFANVYDDGHRDEIIESNSNVSRWSSFPCMDAHKFSAPVAAPEYKPNPWGLMQMLGNIAEWVEDCYGLYSSVDSAIEVSNIEGSEVPCKRVIRGGDWYSSPITIRSAYRASLSQGGSRASVGFRIAKSVTPEIQEIE